MLTFEIPKEAKPEESRREKFLKIKADVQKRYPEAYTIKDEFNSFYVVNKQGFRIIPVSLCVNNSKTVFDAWKNTQLAIKNMKILKSNDTRFSVFKPEKSLISKMLTQE